MAGVSWRYRRKSRAVHRRRCHRVASRCSSMSTPRCQQQPDHTRKSFAQLRTRMSLSKIDGEGLSGLPSVIIADAVRAGLVVRSRVVFSRRARVASASDLVPGRHVPVKRR
eukprot:730835-Rhodomonas_salina.3